MKEYIHRFYSTTAFTNHINNNYYEPWVSSHLTNTAETSSVTITYNLKELGMPLTFEIVSGGTLYWYASHTDTLKTIEYRKNEGEWTSVTSSQDNDGSGTTICDVDAGDILEFRGNNETYATSSRWTIFNSTEDCLFYAYGNIMSLINSNNFRANTYIRNGSFRGLFYLNEGILSHDKKILCLPATSNLNTVTYQDMFNGCTRLKRAPDLPALYTTASCYRGMFRGCTSLEKMPKMNVIDTGSETLREMFYGCTSLKKAYINSGYLGNSCCFNMFYGCTSLEEMEFPEETNTFGPSGGQFRQMFYGCTSLQTITPYKISTIGGGNTCTNMFTNCTSLVDASNFEILTEQLEGRFAEYMFQGCTSLKKGPKIMTTKWGYNCFHGMFQGCTSLEVAPEITCASIVAESCAYSMFQGCTSLTDASTIHLLAETLYAHCYRGMFYGCTSLTTAPQIYATSINDASRCCDSMFYGCSNLTTAPDLLPDTLSYCCYEQMFRGCSKLNYIKCLATTSITGNINNWVTGVQTTSGTFVKAAGMNDWPTGNSGIPTNWTVVDAS